MAHDIMTRTQLLAMANESPHACGVDLDMASHMATPNQIGSMTQGLREHIARARTRAVNCRRFMRCAVWLGAGLIVLDGVIQNQPPTIPSLVPLQTTEWSLFILATALGCLALTALVAGAQSTFDADDSEQALHSVSPVGDSPVGQAVLELVESGHPAVRQWQVLALAERGALAFFDIEVMRCLGDAARRRPPAHDATASARLRARATTAASQALHTPRPTNPN